ncbi:MAG: alpha-L-fucosidase [Bacteroidota bacterium]
MSTENSYLKKLVFFLIATSFVLPVAADEPRAYIEDPDPAIRKRIEEWKDLKFGLLMHWGAYSQWNIVESWSLCPEDLSWATGARKKGLEGDYDTYRKEYEKLQTTFNPLRFDPQAWAEASKAAGMRYVVFTTKHHDGFCMWDTKYTDYKITDVKCPFSNDTRKDVTKEIFNAFRSRGFWTGAYFSKPDWHSDLYWWKKFPPFDRNANYSILKYPEQWNKFIEYTHNQIMELMTGYGQVDILWLDGGWVRKKSEEEVNKTLTEVYEGSRWARNPQSQDIDIPGLVSKVRSKQARTLVVDRDVPGPYQNYLTPEQHIPDTILPYPWETCMTMGGSWSYVATDKYKPADQLIETLVDVVSKGGNLLLNIGPSPEGEFAPEAYDRLKNISVWMQKHNEAIYATRTAENFVEGKRIRFTRSKDGKTTYIFLFDLPGKTIELQNLKLPGGAKITVQGSGNQCNWERTADGIRIRIPGSIIKEDEFVWVLKAKTD